MSKTWTNRKSKHTRYDNPSKFREDLTATEMRGCATKARFAHEKEAMAVARRYGDKAMLFPYKCKLCKEYHLTSRNPAHFY